MELLRLEMIDGYILRQKRNIILERKKYYTCIYCFVSIVRYHSLATKYLGNQRSLSQRADKDQIQLQTCVLSLHTDTNLLSIIVCFKVMDNYSIHPGQTETFIPT